MVAQKWMGLLLVAVLWVVFFSTGASDALGDSAVPADACEDFFVPHAPKCRVLRLDWAKNDIWFSDRGITLEGELDYSWKTSLYSGISLGVNYQMFTPDSIGRENRIRYVIAPGDEELFYFLSYARLRMYRYTTKWRFVVEGRVGIVSDYLGEKLQSKVHEMIGITRFPWPQRPGAGYLGVAAEAQRVIALGKRVRFGFAAIAGGSSHDISVGGRFSATAMALDLRALRFVVDGEVFHSWQKHRYFGAYTDFWHTALDLRFRWDIKPLHLGVFTSIGGNLFSDPMLPDNFVWRPHGGVIGYW